MITATARATQRLAEALTGASAPVPTQLAFGSAQGAVDPNRTALEAPHTTRPVDSVAQAGATVLVTGSVAYEESGDPVIAEVGVLDAGGNLLAYASFPAVTLVPRSQLVVRVQFSVEVI